MINELINETGFIDSTEIGYGKPEEETYNYNVKQ